MLSATLRQLERDGIVERRVHARVPVRVEYELSADGRRLLDALGPLAGWGLEHRDRLDRSRAESERLRAQTQAAARRLV